MISVCVAALLIVLVTTVIYAYYWLTPVIRASGRETTVVLLLGIILSYIFPIAIVSTRPKAPICIVSLIAPGLCSAISYAAIYARIQQIDRIFRVRLSKNRWQAVLQIRETVSNALYRVKFLFNGKE